MTRSDIRSIRGGGQKSGGLMVVCLHGQSIISNGHYDTTPHA